MLSEQDKKVLIEAVSGLNEDPTRPARLLADNPEAAQYTSDIQRLAALLEPPVADESSSWDEAQVDRVAHAIQVRRRWRGRRRFLPAAGIAAAVLLLGLGIQSFNSSRLRGPDRLRWESVTITPYGAFASAGAQNAASHPITGPLSTGGREVAIVRSPNGTRLFCAPATQVQIMTDGSIVLAKGQVMVRTKVPLLLRTADGQVEIEDGEMQLVGEDRGMRCIVFRGQAKVSAGGREHLVTAGHLLQVDPFSLAPATQPVPDWASFAADYDEFRTAR